LGKEFNLTGKGVLLFLVYILVGGSPLLLGWLLGDSFYAEGGAGWKKCTSAAMWRRTEEKIIIGD